jgi:hypothetical protein
VWGSWTASAVALPCASAPTGAPYDAANFKAELDLFYRTPDNHLAEFDIDSSGVQRAFDISNLTGLGEIAGTPAVAMSYSEQQLAYAISIVVKEPVTNKIWTWDWRRKAYSPYPKGWSRHPVTQANGSQAVSYGSVFSTYHFSFQGYIGAKTNPDRFAVFSSPALFAPFSYVNQWGPTERPGVLTFGTPDPSSDGLRAMLYNETTNKVDWWYFNQAVQGTYSSTIKSGGSVFWNYSLPMGWGRGWPTGALLGYSMSGARTVSTISSNTAVSSAISTPVCDGWCNSGLFAVFANSISGVPTLFRSDGSSAGTVSMSYPGGVLAP